MRFYIIFLIGFVLISSEINAQVQTDTLPAVFMIGEHEAAYTRMLSEKPDLLMSVCNDDMEKAYANWLYFLVEIEKFAIENEVDINGVKIWINVFWNPDGSLKHIAFYPKPNSKNMEYEYVKVLFKAFVKENKSELRHSKSFCHYGSASFPSFITNRKKVDK